MKTFAILFSLLASCASAQVGSKPWDCEKLFGKQGPERDDYRDPRLSTIMYYPVNPEAPTVVCVFNEDSACIAVKYLLRKDTAPSFLRVVLQHNGGVDAWNMERPGGNLLAVRTDKKFAVWKQDGEFPALIVCDSRYARLHKLVP